MWILLRQFQQKLVAGQRVVQADVWKPDAAEAARAMKLRPINSIIDGWRRPDARPFRGIELVDKYVNVLGGLQAVDVAGRREQADEFKMVILHGDSDRICRVDARVSEDDEFGWHRRPFYGSRREE